MKKPSQDEIDQRQEENRRRRKHESNRIQSHQRVYFLNATNADIENLYNMNDELTCSESKSVDLYDDDSFAYNPRMLLSLPPISTKEEFEANRADDSIKNVMINIKEENEKQTKTTTTSTTASKILLSKLKFWKK